MINATMIAQMIGRAGHKVDVERPMPSQSPTGGRTNSGWTKIRTQVAAWVQPLSANLRLKYQERQINATHRVYFAADPGLEAEYRVLFGTRPMKYVGGGNRGEMGAYWWADVEESK